jgi:outer membrane receptor protein involved in Fe transport
MKTKFLVFTALLVCALTFHVPAGAQTINGNIVGNITDELGAAVPGVVVTATNVGTGATRTATTDDEGNYRIPALSVGEYKVSAEKSGFNTTTAMVTVTVSADVTADLQLKPGQVQETVTVVGGGALLETTQSQVAKSVESTRILELPGRNSLNGLALLNPGVLPNQNGRPGSGFAVNGNRTRSNNFTIDGANNNDQSLSIPRQNLPPEAIGEFQIITNSFAAEFGRNAGSYVNQITKSGTNEFHGIGHWTWNGNGYDALSTTQERNFRANVAAGIPEDRALRLARSVSVDNIYGGTIGGPIKRNHTFFFTSYDAEDFRTTVGSATRTAITQTGLNRLQALAANPAAGFAPNTVAFLASNFNVSNTPTDQGSVTLVLPAVTCPGSDPNCKVIPFNVFNRGAAGGIPYGTVFDRWLMKVNTKINDSDQLSFRYLIDQASDPGNPTSLPGQEIGANSRNQSFTVNDVYAISPTLINEARFTYSRRKINFPENLDFAFSIGGTGSAFNFGNINFPQNRIDNVYEWTDNISRSTGKHNLKFGYNVLRYQLASFFAPNLDGSVSYGSLLDFVLDRNASFSQFAGTGLTDAVTWEHSMFAQDDWRLNPDLTLNLGLRYEYITTPFGFFSNAKPDINNFAPAIGFAWNPKDMWDGKLVVRGGFRISYDQVFQNVLLNNSRNYPRGVNVAFSNITGQHPFDNLPAPPDPEDFTGNPLLLPLRLFAPNERVRQPRSTQFSFGIQYQLSNDMVFKADYITTKGNNLVREVEQNFGFTAASGLGNGQRLDPTRGSILVGQGIAESVYHAGQFTVERRLSNIEAMGANLGSFLFNVNYTYSSFISEADDVLGGQANRTLPADPRQPTLDKGRSGFDVPHRFVASYVWISPDVFRDNAFLNRIFSSWELAGVTVSSSGTPFHVLNLNNALGILPGQISTVEGSQRVSINPLGQFPLVSTPTTPVANAYFIVHAANSGIVGNMGANTLRTGTTNNTNLGLIKNIRTFGDSQKLQLRLDVFNIFNHRNFTTIPTNSLGNTNNLTNFLNFGLTNIGGRGFQFGARYFF